MGYEIVNRPEYIRVYYWGHGNVYNRQHHTKQITVLSEVSQKFKFLFDMRDLSSQLDPVDFPKLSEYVLSNNLVNKAKIALVCHESDQRSLFTKFGFTSSGILCGVFHEREPAMKWLTKR